MSVVATRRSRTWAVKPEDMVQLRRSAAHLVRTSASRMSRAEVTKRLMKFLQLAEVENACKMMRADLLVRLVDQDGLRAIDIARKTGQRQSDLSQMYRTAKAFPLRARPKNIPYNYFLLAARMVRKFPSLRMQPSLALQLIQKSGLSQHRDVTRHFSERLRLFESKRMLGRSKARIAKISSGIHRARFQDFAEQIPHGAAKIIHVDPPYFYPKLPAGRYTSASSRRRVCDNDIAESSIPLVVDLLRDWQPKLAPDGVLLLWQASGLLHRALMDAIDEFGWAVDRPIIWDKGRVQPGNFERPYSTQTETLLVLSRPGDELINHDGSSRSDILRFPPVSYSGEVDQQHCFEKPQPLCEFLIGKHSYPGELVLDLCGCTGSMSLAAIAAKRHWIYVESNRDNFEMGSARIADALERRAKKTF